MAHKKLIIFMPSIEGGGVEKNFFVISNYLSKKIPNINVISLSKKYKGYLDNRINFISLKSDFWDNIGRRSKFIVCLFILFKELLFSKNVIVLGFQGHLYSILICKLMSAKIIIRSNSSPSGWSKNLIKKFFYKLIYSLSNKIIVNSNEFKKEIKKKFGLNSIYIYNPLNSKEIKRLSKSKIKNDFFKKKYLNLINVARLNEQKDQICLLKSINYLKGKIPIKLLIIGDGKEKEIILDFIYKNKLSKIVKILPFKKNPFPYILESDLFVLSSRYEGLPNILLETIVLKKPILSSNCPTGPKEILDNGKGGLLFKKGDYKDLAKKIILFKNNKKNISKKINHAHKRLYRFNFKTNLQKYYKLVTNLK